MNIRRVILAVVVVSMLFTLAACGSNKKMPKPEGDIVYRPQWWATQPDPAYVCAYGQAVQATDNISLTAAKTNAMFEASEYVKTEIKGMTKLYEQQAGVVDPQILGLSEKVVKAISSATFSGTINGMVETRRVNEYGGTRYKTWMQVKIPKIEIQKNLMNNIRNEEALYNEFKASQAFKELDAEIDKN